MFSVLGDQSMFYSASCLKVFFFLSSFSSSFCWAADWHQWADQWPGQSWNPLFGLQDICNESPLPWHRWPPCPQRAGGKKGEQTETNDSSKVKKERVEESQEGVSSKSRCPHCCPSGLKKCIAGKDITALAHMCPHAYHPHAEQHPLLYMQLIQFLFRKQGPSTWLFQPPVGAVSEVMTWVIPNPQESLGLLQPRQNWLVNALCSSSGGQSAAA